MTAGYRWCRPFLRGPGEGSGGKMERDFLLDPAHLLAAIGPVLSKEEFETVCGAAGPPGPGEDQLNVRTDRRT